MIHEGLAAAAVFLPRAWRASWIALILTSLATAWALSTGAQAIWILVLVIALITRGGLWRLASERGRVGAGGLQFGAVELRLAAVWILAALFLAIIGLLIVVILLSGAYAAASAGKGFDPARIATWAPAIAGGGRILLGAIAGLCGAGFLYVVTRISLAEAATVERGKVQLLSSFALTRGRVIALALGYLVLAAPVIGVNAVGVTGRRNLVWIAAEALAVGGLWLPMSIGLMAYAYRSGVRGP